MLTGKVVWVTGASRGIGRAIALVCAQNGARTVLVARAKEHLIETESLIRKIEAPEPILLDYDLTDPAQVGRAFRNIFREIGRLDVLVNNAGIMKDSLLGMTSAEHIREMFDINVFAMIYHMQYASRLMMRSEGGSIINISSIIGRVGHAGQTAYGASKAAVIGATLSASKELATHRIRINAIAPGFIETDLTKDLPLSKSKEQYGTIGLGRIGCPEDVAKAALFLASDDAAYITGQILGVDGGMIV